MRTRTRRRLDAAVLAGCALLVGGAGGAGAAFGDVERVTRIWTQAEVGLEGGAQISEVIDYDFGALATDKHGIYRVIPQLDPAGPMEVSSPDAPHGFTLSEEAGGTRVRIGDPNRTVSGRKRYLLDYRIVDVVNRQELAWDAVGTGWNVPIDEAEIHLVAPFELHGVRCQVGTVGSSDSCDASVVEPGHVVVEVEGLASHEGVTVRATTGNPVSTPVATPSAPADAPEEPGSGLLPPAAAAAGAALVAAVPATVIVRRAGRERVAPGGAADAAYANHATGHVPGEIRVDHDELAQMATTEFAPPENLTPAQGGVVLRETVQPEHKVAWLIEAAIAGDVDLEEENGKPVRLRRTGHSPERAGILDVAFDGRDELALGEYDESFGQAWGQVGMELETWRARSGLWDPAGDLRRIVALVLGIVAAVLGVLIVIGGGWLANSRGGPAGLVVAAVGAAVAAGGLTAAISGWELRVRTPAGSAAWLRVESFRRFLAESEAFHAEEAAKRGVLREYTAWAVAVGEIDRWSRAVAASSVIPASAGVSYAYMAPALIASTSSTATAPSSSSGSGVGGGGVGGGAGGGGGGSW
ncbi:MAG TPA: DUF2207 domain-containing protein [Acidimicrobiales bacterium]